jgi:hypothetical protein
VQRFHRLTVGEVRRETPDCVSLAFDVPHELDATFRFHPGQHLTLRAELDGADLRRSYSICSALDERELRVAVKRVPGGAFSTFANQRLRAGAAESDTSVVSYFGERDPEDRRVLNLMRRETRRLQAEDPNLLVGESYILCPDVSPVKISYYDHKRKEWTTDWNTLNASGQQYLPTHIRIILTVFDERGQEVSYTTDARIQMTEKVSYRPAAQ